jgi:hypothetical protein
LSPEAIKGVLGTLGINLESKDMRVLGAVLAAQREPTEFVGFDQIRKELSIIEEGKRGEDPLVYRSLSQLERMGLLEIQHKGKSHGYRSNVGLIQRAADTLIDAAIENLVSELAEIDRQIEHLDSIDEDEIVADMISYALGPIGSSREERTLFAQGWNEILSLIDKKIYRDLSENDLVRITLEWVNQPQNVEEQRLLSIEAMIRQGVQFKALDHRPQSTPRLDKYREITRRMLNLGFNPGFVISPRKDATYQFIARNNQGIVLIVSENPLSATWIPRVANPELVDDAIESFDADFEEGVDVFEYEGA